REWRRIIKPEKCPVCAKGHSYQAELDRHIVVHHPDVAVKHGVSTKRHVCKWCNKSYARPDHLVRHMILKHGRPKGRSTGAGG
ncbi:hypothetical protein P885DRAFT_27595, partial [Corynascus similis CBS 632.67]